MDIYINNTRIDFFGKIPIELNSGIFSNQNTFSRDIKIPLTHRNKAIFKRLHLFEVDVNKQSSFEMKIKSAYVNISGVLKIISINNDSIRGTLSGKNDYITTFKNKKVNEYYICDIDLVEEVDRGKYCWPTIYNPGFFDHIKEEMPKLIGYYKNYVNYIYYDYEGSKALALKEKQYGNVPFFKMFSVIKEILQQEGFSVIDKINNNDLKQLCLYHNNMVFYRKISNIGGAYFISNCEFVSGAAEDEDNVILTIDDWDHNDKSIVIVYSYVDVGNFKNHYILLKKDSDNKYIISGLHADSLPDPEGGYYGSIIPCEEELTLFNNEKINERMLPDMTVQELFKQLKDYFGINILYNENDKTATLILIDNIITNNTIVDTTDYIYSQTSNISLSEKKGILLRNSEDESDQIIKENINEIDINKIKNSVSYHVNLFGTGNHNDIRRVRNEDNLYEKGFYIFKKFLIPYDLGPNYADGRWNFLSRERSFRIIGNPPYHEINTSISLFDHSVEIYRNGIDIKMVKANQPANHLEEKTKMKGIRLFFLRQNIMDVDNISVDITNVDNTNSEGTIIGNLCLNFYGTYGIYNQLKKNYFHFLLNIKKEGKIKIHWPFHLLNDFDFTKKYSFNHIRFFVKSIKFDIDHQDNIKFGDTEIIKCE